VRGALFGLTRNTGPAELAYAAMRVLFVGATFLSAPCVQSRIPSRSAIL